MSDARKSLIALILCLAVVHIGWMKFYYPSVIYWIDYTERVVVIVIFLMIVGPIRLQRAPEFKYIGAAIVAALAFYLSDILITAGLIRIGAPLDGDKWPPLFGWLKLFDVTIGLALTAVSEEIIYRRLFATVIERAAILYPVSAVVFASLHANQGIASTANAFVAGLIFMALYRWSGRLFVPVLAHYLANLIFFGLPGLKPKLLALLG